MVPTHLAFHDEKKEIPLTSALLSFIQMMQDAKRLRISENICKESLGMPRGNDYRHECEQIFSGQFSKVAKEMGLQINAFTLGALLDANITTEMNSMESEDLPKNFIFKAPGGILRITDAPDSVLSNSHKPKANSIIEPTELLLSGKSYGYRASAKLEEDDGIYNGIAITLEKDGEPMADIVVGLDPNGEPRIMTSLGGDPDELKLHIYPGTPDGSPPQKKPRMR